MKRTRLDDFSDAGSWMPVASGEAKLQLRSEPGPAGHALRMDFDFMGGGGFVVARKEFRRALPASYAFRFRLRGAAPRNKFEFKLVDPSGRNVWRWQEDDFEFTPDGRDMRLRNSRIDFAWGPAGGGTLRQLGAIEFVISAGPGGKGNVSIEDFLLEDLDCRKKPVVSSSNGPGGVDPAVVLATAPANAWRGRSRAGGDWLQVDFHQARELGGLIIEWEKAHRARAFRVLTSADSAAWRTLHQCGHSTGLRSFVPLPDTEARFLRIVLDTPATGIRQLAVQPFDFSRSQVDFVHAVAASQPRGWHPRWLHREQSYWTCAGVPDGHVCALVNEEGMVEPHKGSFSIEPFLHTGGRLFTWADARRRVSLEDDSLPIPSAWWRLPDLRLQTTVFGTGHGKQALVHVRYRISNTAPSARRVKLLLALRPFQVNPPWQAWQGLGGPSETKEIEWKDPAAIINRTAQVIPLHPPDRFGALAFPEGQIGEWLAAGKVPPHARVRDATGLASAVLCFERTIAPGGSDDVFLTIPCSPRNMREMRKLATRDGAHAFAESLERMRARLGKVRFQMPGGTAAAAARTFHTAAGQILVNRDGPALQPGPRRYTRSWIRDGAIMGAALLRAGDADALRDFLRWFAPWQRKDGFVPCCVDRSGADWLIEHDSHGQLAYAVLEVFRFTGDHAFLREMWPHIRKAVTFLERLRATRLSPEYREPAKRACLGLLPESASHEGYLAHPVHSYWDDFWAMRGLQDAATAAEVLGRHRDAARFGALARDFRASVRDSVRRVIATRKLDYIPGSVEWADFDPTATANAVSMLDAARDLPAGPLATMFERFTEDFRRKHSGEMPWNNYTAYEIRIVGALVRLGKRREAVELLETFLADRRPRDWNQWPEISWRDPRSPGHLGDVPHTWIAAEYMLSFASMFAFEHEPDQSLVLAAGLPVEWIDRPGGVAVRGLPTWYGSLDLDLRRTKDGTLVVRIGGPLKCPAGGFVLRPPVPIRSLSINGQTARKFTSAEVRIRTHPAEIVIG